jgi:hypothetical protein
MDLISHVTGVTVTGNFTPGASTPSPYNVTHVGATDGTGPQNASKNMAEIYNRILLNNDALIQMAGLSVDHNNWVQAAQAVLKVAGGMDGGTCPNTGPASAPSLTSPYTQYTGVTSGEKWQWVGGAWVVVGKYYKSSSLLAGVNLAAATPTNITTLTAMRDGPVNIASLVCGLSQTAGGNILASYIIRTRSGTTVQLGDTLINYTTATMNQLALCRGATPADVLQGDVYTLVGLASLACNLSPSNGNALYMQYTS